MFLWIFLFLRGDAYIKTGASGGIAGSITFGDVIISDPIARTPGNSDVNMYVRVTNINNGVSFVTTSSSFKFSTAVKYLDINKTKKQIKVKHSWKTS